MKIVPSHESGSVLIVPETEFEEKVLHRCDTIKMRIEPLSRVVFREWVNKKAYVEKATMGRPTIITRKIGNFILENDKVPSRKLSKMIKETFGQNVSPNTICNYRKV